MKHFTELFEQIIRLVKYQYNFQEKNIVSEMLEVDKTYLSKVKQGHVPSTRTLKKIIVQFDLNTDQELAILFAYFSQKNREEAYMLNRMLALLTNNNELFEKLHDHFDQTLNDLRPKTFIKKEVGEWGDQLALPII